MSNVACDVGFYSAQLFEHFGFGLVAFNGPLHSYENDPFLGSHIPQGASYSARLIQKGLPYLSMFLGRSIKHITDHFCHNVHWEALNPDRNGMTQLDYDVHAVVSMTLGSIVKTAEDLGKVYLTNRAMQAMKGRKKHMPKALYKQMITSKGKQDFNPLADYQTHFKIAKVVAGPGVYTFLNNLINLFPNHQVFVMGKQTFEMHLNHPTVHLEPTEIYGNRQVTYESVKRYAYAAANKAKNLQDPDPFLLHFEGLTEIYFDKTFDLIQKTHDLYCSEEFSRQEAIDTAQLLINHALEKFEAVERRFKVHSRECLDLTMTCEDAKEIYEYYEKYRKNLEYYKENPAQALNIFALTEKDEL